MIFRLVHGMAKARALEAVRNAPEGFVVEIKEPTRNLEQNAALWAKLNDIATQVEWHGRNLTAEEWKHVFTAALTRQDVVPNLDGTGFVVLGQSTSRMSKKLFSELLELITAFGSERGVKWSDSTYPDIDGGPCCPTCGKDLVNGVCVNMWCPDGSPPAA